MLRAIVARIVAIVTGGGRRRTTVRRRGPISRLGAAVRGLLGGRRRR